MPTASTVPLLLVMVVVWRITKGELLSVVLFVSVFEAASMLNLGGFGVAPWIFSLSFGMIVKALGTFQRPRLIAGCNLWAVRILLVFVAYAVWTGMVHPFLFEGVPVFSSHGAGLLVPLSWGSANLFQILYLMAVTAIYFYAMCSSREALQSALDWYVRGCLLICFFAFYQLANATVHIPYPSPVLYSNPGHVIYPAYRINGMWRLNSILPEASAMAFHLSVGLALQAQQVLTKGFRWRSALGFGAMLLCLVLTQSSSGYLCIGFMALISGLLYLAYLLKRGAVPKFLMLGYVLFALAGVIAAVSTSAPDLVRKEVQSVLLEKKNSASYRERSASNDAALQAARNTYYLGAGYGSLRCSGLGYMLLGNVGVPGLLLFGCFCVSLYVPLIERRRRKGQGLLYERSLLAAAVLLFSAALAGAEPVSPIIWLVFAAASAGPAVVRPIHMVRMHPPSATKNRLSYQPN